MATVAKVIPLANIQPASDADLKPIVESFITIFVKAPPVDECLKQLKGETPFMEDEWGIKPWTTDLPVKPGNNDTGFVKLPSGETVYYLIFPADKTGVKETFIFHLISKTPFNYGIIAPCVKCLYEEAGGGKKLLLLKYTESDFLNVSTKEVLSTLAYFNRLYNLRFYSLQGEPQHKIINTDNGPMILDFSRTRIFNQPTGEVDTIKRNLPWAELEGNTYAELLISLNKKGKDIEFVAFKPKGLGVAASPLGVAVSLADLSSTKPNPSANPSAKPSALASPLISTSNASSVNTGKLSKNDPDLMKYSGMKKAGVPHGAIKQKLNANNTINAAKKAQIFKELALILNDPPDPPIDTTQSVLAQHPPPFQPTVGSTKSALSMSPSAGSTGATPTPSSSLLASLTSTNPMNRLKPAQNRKLSPTPLKPKPAPADPTAAPADPTASPAGSTGATGQATSLQGNDLTAVLQKAFDTNPAFKKPAAKPAELKVYVPSAFESTMKGRKRFDNRAIYYVNKLWDMSEDEKKADIKALVDKDTFLTEAGKKEIKKYIDNKINDKHHNNLNNTDLPYNNNINTLITGGRRRKTRRQQRRNRKTRRR
jgi:hypothetical protein